MDIINYCWNTFETILAVQFSDFIRIYTYVYTWVLPLFILQHKQIDIVILL